MKNARKMLGDERGDEKKKERGKGRIVGKRGWGVIIKTKLWCPVPSNSRFTGIYCRHCVSKCH